MILRDEKKQLYAERDELCKRVKALGELARLYINENEELHNDLYDLLYYEAFGSFPKDYEKQKAEKLLEG